MYDSIGRLIRVTDPAGSTSYTLNARNEIIQITDPLQGSTTVTYDAGGNVLSYTDALQHTIAYAYDDIGRVISRTDALGHSETRAYDLNGNLSSFTDRNGNVTHYTYDALDRLTRVQYADQSTIAYTYDAGNRVTQIADSLNGSINRTYDSLDRLLSEMTPSANVSYTHDAAGQRTTMNVAGQTPINYSYDAAGNLTGLTQGSLSVALTYDNANRRASLTLANGVRVQYGYDAASQMTSIDYSIGATSLGNLVYSYDAAGRRSGVGGSLARTSLPAALSGAVYTSANQISQGRGRAFTYDLDGNLLNDGIHTYSWSTRGHLAAVDGVGILYDGTGRRIQNGSGTRYVYDHDSVVQEITPTGVSATFLSGLTPDEVYGKIDASGVQTFLSDALGSTLALMDATGTVETQYTYEPFGRTTSSGPASPNEIQFTGRENDSTGLYYYRARYYSPDVGSFISEDPTRVDNGINSYAYADGDPVGRRDPLGLGTICTWAGDTPWLSWRGAAVRHYYGPTTFEFARAIGPENGDELPGAAAGVPVSFIECHWKRSYYLMVTNYSIVRSTVQCVQQQNCGRSRKWTEHHLHFRSVELQEPGGAEPFITNIPAGMGWDSEVLDKLFCLRNPPP